jgi:hypothetical protein
MLVTGFLIIAVILPSYPTLATHALRSSPNMQAAPSHIDVKDTTTATNETAATLTPTDQRDYLVVLSTESIEQMKATERIIERLGGSISNVFPPHLMIAGIPASQADTLLGAAGIEGLYYGPVDASQFAKYGDNARLGIEFWNRKYFGLDTHPELAYRGAVDPDPIANDTRVANRSLAGLRENTGLAANIPYGAGFYDTSEYLLGSATILMIFPESNGAIDPNTETWTQADIDAVVSEIVQGVNWWKDRETNARLSFTFAYYSTSQTSTRYEPISRPYTGESLWIAEIMNGLGYSSYSNYFDKVYAANNDERSYYGTDWAYTIFVVNSKNDADGLFTDGYFAYAYLGGPFMVMTYDNDNYGIANMDAVTAHEMGHIFYALDQYTSAGHGCTESSGYLNVQNQNSAYPSEGSCLSNVPSIMRGQVSPYTAGAIDSYARQQVGWRDTNSNGRPDIVDLFPENTLYEYSPDPTVDLTPTYSGVASSRTCYPNSNPQYWHPRHDITINTISRVEYWVEDSNGNKIRDNQDATPNDGQFDSDLEGYTFTVTPDLPPGTYRFASIAWSFWNAQGNGVIVRDTLTIAGPTTVTKTVTITSTSTSYTTRYTTTTLTSYTSTSTSTSTILTLTTIVLVPLTVTSTVQSTQYQTSVLTTTVTSYTSTQSSTSTIVVPTTVVLVPLTVTSTVQSIQYLTSVLTTTVTSYTSTQTSTSTIPTVTTVALVPLTVTSTIQSTQYQTSILTTTVTSYTSTQTSTSTIPTVTTVVLFPSTVTSTIQSTQFLTSIATTTVTSYTATTTSTSTSVVYTTVTASPGGAGAGASSPLAYLGFLSLLAVMVGRRITAGKGGRILRVRSLMERRSRTE